MESTGVYWKSVFSHLEAAGIAALVVNAYHVKNVPGRKTDVSDSEWLAQLARFGLLRGSFIPPKDLRELRIVSRYRRKLSAAGVGEKKPPAQAAGRCRDQIGAGWLPILMASAPAKWSKG
jgi:transposase